MHELRWLNVCIVGNKTLCVACVEIYTQYSVYLSSIGDNKSDVFLQGVLSGPIEGMDEWKINLIHWKVQTYAPCNTAWTEMIN